MRLLSIDGNSKIVKTNKAAAGQYLFAGLSLMPDNITCPAAKAAGCMDVCLQSAGRGVFSNVRNARQGKTDWWHTDRDGFLDQLRKDLHAFERKAAKLGVLPVVRLNVLSDIAWEDYGVPQDFPAIRFYDYTKRQERLGRTPANYHLTFSYSAAPTYARQVERALNREPATNVAVVFSGGLPAKFLGRRVVDGDLHDIRIEDSAGIVIGLRAKGRAKKQPSDFVIPNPDLIGSAS